MQHPHPRTREIASGSRLSGSPAKGWLLPLLVVAATILLGWPVPQVVANPRGATVAGRSPAPPEVEPLGHPRPPSPSGLGPRSMVLFVGSGMGAPQIQAARLMKALVAAPAGPSPQEDAPGPATARLSIDRLPFQGAFDAQSADAVVPDDASVATALATGVRVRNGALSIRPDGQSIETLLEVARQGGKATGLVSTLPLSGATPAAFAVHLASGSDQADVARRLAEAEVDVLLGGGAMFFHPPTVGEGTRTDGRNLAEELEEKGYRVVSDREGLLEDVRAPRLLGLFARGAMSFEIDRPASREPSLAEMTRAALASLASNPRGFLLVVEAGRIDWAAHDNDLVAMTRDLLALDDAVSVAVEFQSRRRNTLVVVAGNHETGGLAFPPRFDLAPLSSVTCSVHALVSGFPTAALDPNNDEFVQAVRERLGLDLDVPAREKLKLAQNEPRAILRVLAGLLNAKAGVMFASTAHTGLHPPIYARGPGADRLSGFRDVTEIHHRLRALLGVH